MSRITVEAGQPGFVIIRMPYDPGLLSKVKTIPGRQWHSAEKYWAVPSRQDIAQILIDLFAPDPVEISPELKPHGVEKESRDDWLRISADFEGELKIKGYSPKTCIMAISSAFPNFVVKNQRSLRKRIYGNISYTC